MCCRSRFRSSTKSATSLESAFFVRDYIRSTTQPNGNASCKDISHSQQIQAHLFQAAFLLVSLPRRSISTYRESSFIDPSLRSSFQFEDSSHRLSTAFDRLDLDAVKRSARLRSVLRGTALISQPASAKTRKSWPTEHPNAL